MDESSDSGLGSLLKKIFSSKSDNTIEATIREAREDGILGKEESVMLLNILRFSSKLVADVMIPRTDIVAAEVNTPIRELAHLFIKSGHSRIPIYRENKDSIIGVVHTKDLLAIIHLPEDEQPPLEETLRRPLFLPESKPLGSTMVEFKTKKVHLAIAVDEYGGTSGLITFEDVLEEIVGEIEDEYDEPRPEDIRVLDNNKLLLSGRTELKELAEEHDIHLNSEQVETVSGYITEKIGRVPHPGELLIIEDQNFRIRDADAKQVHTVILEPPDGN